MGDIGELLKHIPEAAKSPLGFVAYGLVIAAWVLHYWLAANPRRQAQKILEQFKDDQKRLAALTQVFNEPPPSGLSGNDAILDWVRIRSAEKSRMLMVVAWLGTLVGVLIFLVAINNTASGAGTSHVTVTFHRLGTTDDCPSLPGSAHASVSTANGPIGDFRITGNCKVTFSAPSSGSAVLTLQDAGPYALADPGRRYDVATPAWDAYLISSAEMRLRLSLFEYSSLGCSDVRTAFDAFEEILSTKVRSVRGMFTADHRFDYLANLSVTTAGKRLDLSPQEIPGYLQETRSLQVLSGACFKKDGTEYMRSEIFLGSLSGGLPEPLFTDLPVNADELGAIRDLHTATILYALAQDALVRKMARDITIAYLSHARQLTTELHAPAAVQLLQVIEHGLTAAGAPPPIPL